MALCLQPVIKVISIQEKMKKPHPKAIKYNLLFLGTTTSRPLSLLNSLLIRLDITTSHSLHQTSCLPGALQVTGCGLAEDVDLDELGFESAFERDDTFSQLSVYN